MTVADDARRRITTSLDAFLDQRADSAHRELDALRGAMDQHIAAIAALLTNADGGGSLEPVVDALSRAALEQAEAAAARARLESEKAAHAALVAARAESQTRLDAELASNVALRETLDHTQRQLQTLHDEIAAMQQLHAATAAELGDEQAAKAALADTLADVQREVATVRDHLQTREDSLAAVEAHLQALNGERAQLQQARDEADARLAADTHQRMALATALAQAQGSASDTAAEIERYRAGLEAAAQQVRAANDTHERLEADVQDERRRGALARVALDRVQTALQAFDAVTSASDLLEAFVVQLGHAFARAAIFFVRDACLEGWHGVGLDPTTTMTNLAVPLTVDGPLTRALRDNSSVRVTANAEGDLIGFFGRPVASVIAVPIRADGQVVAVAYAEQAQESLGTDADASQRMADILGDYVSRRLTAMAARASAAERNAAAASAESTDHERLGEAEARPQPSPGPSVRDAPPLYPGPARQAPRVRMPEGIEVLVDSGVGVLVDLSNRGAQLVSSTAMRPNHTVRVVLPRSEGALPCNGRIVWAVCERCHSSGMAVYRAGVHFTSVDARAVDAFLIRHGGDPNVSSPLLATR